MHRGQPGEEQYGDISSVGEYDRPINIGRESRRSSLVEPTLSDTHLDLTVGFVVPTRTLRHPLGASQHQECQARSDGLFPP